MAETIARIDAQGRVELIDERSATIESVVPMASADPAFLARGTPACAAALSSAAPPAAGAIGGDAHLPIMTWLVGSSNNTGDPLLVVTIPTCISLTFQMPAQGAMALGAALLAQGKGSSPAWGPAPVRSTLLAAASASTAGRLHVPADEGTNHQDSHRLAEATNTYVKPPPFQRRVECHLKEMKCSPSHGFIVRVFAPCHSPGLHGE